MADRPDYPHSIVRETYELSNSTREDAENDYFDSDGLVRRCQGAVYERRNMGDNVTGNNGGSAQEVIVVVDDRRSEAFSDLRGLPQIDLSAVDLDRIAQQVQDEIARRCPTPPVDHSGSRCDGARDGDVPDEWLLIECDVPDCAASVEVDLVAADPAGDEPPLHTMLAGHGWSSDGEGRDLCPQHRPA